MTGIPQGSVQPPYLFVVSNGQPVTLSQQGDQSQSTNYVTQLPLMQFPIQEMSLVKEQNNAGLSKEQSKEQLSSANQSKPSYNYDNALRANTVKYDL